MSNMVLSPERLDPGPVPREQGWLRRSAPIAIYADEWGGVGGTAGYVRMLARGFTVRGYRVGVFCHDTPPMAPFMAQLEAAGADIVPMPAPGRGPVGRLAVQRELVRSLAPYQGGVLALMMGYHSRGGGIALAARFAGVRAAVRADLTPPEPPLGRFEGLALRLKDRLVDAVVVGAEENRRAFHEAMGRDLNKCSVIHTGITLSRLEPGRGREERRRFLGLSGDVPLVGTLCRLSDRRKGVHDFLAMAAAVHDQFPSARFVVVGDGVLKDELRARAEQLGVGAVVSFPGWSEDVTSWYAAMDVFVMASTHEGGPTTVLEAMAMGLPVVATRVGMVPEVVDDGRTGIVCPVANPPALAEAVSALLSSEARRRALGGFARATAWANFADDAMVEAYLRLFGRAWGARTR